MAAGRRGRFALPKMVDEGGWTFEQVIVWCTTRDLDSVRRCSTPEGTRRHHLYPSASDPAFPPKIEGEPDSEASDRITKYHRLMDEARNRALAEMTQALRLGELDAIDANGVTVPKLHWQGTNPNSPVNKRLSYPSSRVRASWPALSPGKPSDDQVRKVIKLICAQRRQGPIPKKASLISDVRSQLPRATVRQVKSVLFCLSGIPKNPVGRPKKNNSEK